MAKKSNRQTQAQKDAETEAKLAEDKIGRASCRERVSSPV